MKKRKKKLFSKALAYLMILVAVVAAFFWAVNYTTSQKLSYNTQAGGAKCKQSTPKGDWYKVKACSEVRDKGKTKDQRQFYQIYSPVDAEDWEPRGYLCCFPGAMPAKGKDCRQAGGKGADWYSAGAEKELLTSTSKKYFISITDVTNSVGDFYKKQYPDKNCLIVEYINKESCAGLKGIWKKDSCAHDEGDKYYYTPTYPNGETLGDYKSGFVCCKQGSLLPGPTNKPKPTKSNME